MIRSGLIVSGLLFSSLAFSDFLPENNLYLQDNTFFAANLTESEFNDLTNSVIGAYQAVVNQYGATLTARVHWDDSTVNADTEQTDNAWIINMYGGLARRPEVTRDAFLLVVCHELGHHLGGFPMHSAWAANEGQADYFAAQTCAARMWSRDVAENARARNNVDPTAQRACDAKWSEPSRQNVCYRTAMAGLSLGNLLGALQESTTSPSYDMYDATEVPTTFNGHPNAQCRLDTLLAGAICTVPFNYSVIPGKGLRPTEAEVQAYRYSCSENTGYTDSARPHCWFKRKF